MKQNRAKTIEDVHVEEMIEYRKSAIYYLELSVKVVESDDDFNDGQSAVLNHIYDNTMYALGTLEKLVEEQECVNYG